MTNESVKTFSMPNLVEYLLENHRLKFSPAGMMTIDGEKIQAKDVSSWFFSFCKSEETRKYLDLMVNAQSPTVFLETLKTMIRIKQSNNRTELFQGGGMKVKSFEYEGHLPFISITNHKKVVFFNKNTHELSNLDYETYAKVVDKEFQLRPLPAVIEFNPYRPEQIYKDKTNYGQECTHLNTYKRPEWQHNRKLSPEEAQTISKLPALVNEFFTHLFPDTNCREFVYDWLHYSLTSRCETYLVMNGAKGVGKNVLSNTICNALIGKKNHKIAQPSALNGDFNAILAESRMIVFDEFKIQDDEDINKLKRYANADQMIERKGVDVGETEKTYNSYIICNNSLTDMKIVWDDRRFSVVDLTDKKLNDIWSEDKINELIAMFENENSEELRQFGYWLLYRKPSVMTGEFSMYRGEHFYRLCYSSMPEWSKMIVDVVTSGDKAEYEEADLKMMFKDRTGGAGRFPNTIKVEDFLKNYKHKGQHYLGNLVKENGTNYLYCDEAFVKSTEDSTGIQWQSVGDLL